MTKGKVLWHRCAMEDSGADLRHSRKFYGPGGSERQGYAQAGRCIQRNGEEERRDGKGHLLNSGPVRYRHDHRSIRRHFSHRTLAEHWSIGEHSHRNVTGILRVRHGDDYREDGITSFDRGRWEG